MGFATHNMIYCYYIVNDALLVTIQLPASRSIANCYNSYITYSNNLCQGRIPVTIQQGVPGDAVPWPEREVSSHNLLFFQAAAGGAKEVPE